jgi:hypothetical protein
MNPYDGPQDRSRIGFDERRIGIEIERQAQDAIGFDVDLRCRYQFEARFCARWAGDVATALFIGEHRAVIQEQEYLSHLANGRQSRTERSDGGLGIQQIEFLLALEYCCPTFGCTTGGFVAACVAARIDNVDVDAGNGRMQFALRQSGLARLNRDAGQGLRCGRNINFDGALSATSNCENHKRKNGEQAHDVFSLPPVGGAKSLQQ